MIEKILSALKAEGIETYAMHETRSQSAEVFFVRKNMDLKRRTDLTDYSVTVFRELESENGKLLGSSSVAVYPGMGEAELRRTLKDAYYAASLAGNQHYELLEGKKESLLKSESALAKMELPEILKVMGDALFAPDTEDDVFVNSAELFAVKRERRVVNSRGVDVSWETNEVRGEYVIQCVAPQDVETYHSFAYLEPDAKALRADVENSLRQTRDRASAVESPKAGEYTVILSGNELRELFSFYQTRSNAAMIYQHFSDYAVGKAVQGEEIRGDKLTIELAGTEAFDEDGVRLVPCVLIKDGVLEAIHGSVRFARYLDIEPTGSYSAIRVPTGSTPLDEIKARPHLHVVTFSDFQMDPMSGHFGGEIRLAYLFDGEKTVPVTGGSINGSLLEAQKSLTLSKERYTIASYDGPFAVAIPGVKVAGA